MRDHHAPQTGFAKPAILLIDDDEGDMLLARHTLDLSALFGEILTASSADEALAMFRNHPKAPEQPSPHFPPALVLLDIWMPRKTGHDFLAEFAPLHRRAEYRDVRVAMLSSSSDDRDRSGVETYDFIVDYLVKPLRIEDVEHLLQTVSATA